MDYFKEAMRMYPDIYSLKPLREIDEDWWRLKWKPLWKKTFNLYVSPVYRTLGLGFRCWRGDARNGWNRSYKRLDIEVWLLFWTCSFWIKWDYIVHRGGPTDMGFLCPLRGVG